MLHRPIKGDLPWYQSSPLYKTGEKYRTVLTTSQSKLKSTGKRCHADWGIARCYLPKYMASHVRRIHLATLKYVSVLNARVQITWNLDPHNPDDSKSCSLRINRYAMTDCCPQAVFVKRWLIFVVKYRYFWRITNFDCLTSSSKLPRRQTLQPFL
jgi:hypothetical protein